MGTYTELTISDYPVISSKSAVIPHVMTVFREGDKKIFQRMPSERNSLVWGESHPDEDDEPETAVIYESSAKDVADRLDVMGFTLRRSREEYEDIRRQKIEEYETWDRNDLSEPKIKPLKALSFDRYVELIGEVIRSRLIVYGCDYEKINQLDPEKQVIFSEDEYPLGFYCTDVRSLIRVVCSAISGDAAVVQDISALVDSGYYSINDSVCERAVKSLTEDHPENAPRIILTEGISDAEILKISLELLYPHLSEYYTFMDFSAFRAQGSAGNLVTLVKAFAAAGISNRIIAIFDNDTAARDAMRSLSAIMLPKNIVVVRYPELEFLKNYPTLGPNGRSNLDVNGLAASIELYLGSDILKDSDGDFFPVHWKGYVEGMQSYQGEVMRKAEIQSAFHAKVGRCSSSVGEMESADWQGVRLILQSLFNAFP